MPTSPGRRRLVLLGFLLALALRLWACARPPAETTDVLRNLGYGRAFWSHGLAVYDLRPEALAGGRGWEKLWPTHTYDYPVVALLFWAAVAAATQSLVVAKVALTLLELANAGLVARLTGSPRLGLAYFAAPASVWWVSHEGQFEPLPVGLALGALLALRARREALAWALLGLAVQAKLLPLLLAPALLARTRGAAGPLAFAGSFLPSLLAVAQGSYLRRMLDPGYWPEGCNAFAWNALEPAHFDWIPGWLVAWNALLSGGLLVAAALLGLRALARGAPRTALGYVPLLAFLAFLKSMRWGMFWYLLQAVPFALALEEPRPRAALALLPLLEGRGTSALVVGPVGLGQWFPIEEYLHGDL